MRDRALFDLANDSKLRGCDLVKIKIGTLVTGPAIRTRAVVVQQNTRRPVQVGTSRMPGSSALRRNCREVRAARRPAVTSLSLPASPKREKGRNWEMAAFAETRIGLEVRF